MTDLPITQRLLIKATPNAAFKLIIVMIALGGVDLGNKQLAKNSGLSLPTVQATLDHLADIGLATQTRRYNGWSLTTGVQELLPGSQKVFDSLIKVESESLLKNKIIDINTTTLRSSKDFDSPPSKVPEVPQDKIDVLVRLHQMGIKDPKASHLAILDHVTPLYLEEFDLGILYGILDIPLAIHMIQHGKNWTFTSPDKCPGCRHYYGSLGFKSLDHGPDCWVKDRAIRLRRIRKDEFNPIKSNE